MKWAKQALKSTGWALLVMLFMSSSSFALTKDQENAFDNGVYFFNTELDPCLDATTASRSAAANAGGDNVLTAMNFFVTKGLTAVQAAGIVGNLHAESGILPGRQERQPPSYIAAGPINGIGFGIAQWTYTSRQGPLVAAAKKANVAVNTLPVQLEYVWTELNAGYKGALAHLKNTNTVRDATRVILLEFEKPLNKGESVVTTRTNYSNGDLNKFQKAGGVVSAGGAGNFACGETIGSISGDNCKSIGKTSAQERIGNPYVCENKELKCPAGIDMGVKEGYAGGKPYAIRICKVQNISVNAFIADEVNGLLTKSGQPAPTGLGRVLVGGAFRTMQQQKDLWNSAQCYNRCKWPVADPGYSNHQMGLAIDFANIGISDRGNPKYIWLNRAENAKAYGLKNLPSEAWHWSVNGN